MLDQRTKRQARARVNNAVTAGHLPHPRTLPCTDCGHVWAPGGRRHEYDHHLGHDPVHWLDVQVVCSACHRKRELARGTMVLGDNARMDRMRAARKRVLACVVCGVYRPPFRHGRCNACALYFKAWGVERPQRLWR